MPTGASFRPGVPPRALRPTLRALCPPPLSWSVLSEPTDLDGSRLRVVLEERWRLTTPALAYLPVGFGSHHWLAADAHGRRLFVSVDDLEAPFQAGPGSAIAFAALARAFRTAVALRERAHLPFVAAPIPDRAGEVLVQLTSRYAVRVEPFVDGEAGAYGAPLPPDDGRRVARAIGRLHAATRRLPTGLVRRDTFAIVARPRLETALAGLGRPWLGGPHSEPARRVLRQHAGPLRERLRAYDALASRLGAQHRCRVVTHGEPHPANILLGSDGSLHLVDWDKVLLAPAERDLRFVLDGSPEARQEYQAVTGTASPDPDVLRLYRWRWDLEDIAVSVAGFLRPHARTADTLASWGTLVACLEV